MSKASHNILVPMSLINSSKFMVSSSHYVANINRALKDIKSDTLANFIHIDQCRLTVTTNKVASLLDLSTIERYIKNVDTINSEENMMSRLPQSKSYLKILGISYIMKRTNVPITFSIVEKLIKTTHIFNNVVLTLKPCIIKVLPKSDIVVKIAEDGLNFLFLLFSFHFHFHFHFRSIFRTRVGEK